MTINLSDNTPRVSYTVAQGVTQTSFTVSFEFFAEADLNVYVDGTLKTLTTDYSVSGGSGATGSITMSVTGATGGSTVVITRDIALERTTDFPAAGAFQIASLNTELDKITAQFADRKDDVDRSLRLKDQDAAVSMELPLKATRLGTVLGFNATTGAPEAGPTIANVNSLADITTNINTVAGISSNVTTVAGISANVTTVAGISSNVSTVAGISSNVTSVAGNATNINTVATNISNINSVAAKSSLITSDFVSDLNTLAVTDVINDINTLATSDIVSDLNTLATSDIVSDLNTLATSDIVSDINTLATSDIVTDLNLLATSDFVSDLNTIATTTNVNNLATVAGAVSNVNTVAGISSDVTAVAGISSDVAAVEDIAANVTSVAGNASNINAAVSNASNINAVVSNASNINSVAGIAANVTTVAGIASNVTTVAGAASNVSTVAGAITNVNNVGGSIANVNTVATNISGVNSFAERYRVGSSDPSSSLDAGDLAYNTSDNALKYYTGSAWASITAGIGNVVEDTTPQLGGDLQSNGNDIVIADTDNIYVGTSNDGLKIHHSNNNSFIEDVGTGNFLITTNGNNIQLMKNQTEQMLVAKTDGSVELYHDNAKKLETTSSGVSVTGGLNTTGNVGIGSSSPAKPLTVVGGDFSTVLLDNSNAAHGTQILFQANGATNSGADIQMSDAGGMKIRTLAVEPLSFHTSASAGSPSERLRITSGGNVGIGTTSPVVPLQVKASSPAVSLQASASKTSGSRADFNAYNSDVSTVGYIRFGAVTDNVGTDIQFANRPAGGSLTERLRIDSSGNVGIGTASPSSPAGFSKSVTLYDASDASMVVNAGGSYRSEFAVSSGGGWVGTYDAIPLRFVTGNGERMRLDSSGNLLVATSSTNATNGFTVFPTGSGTGTMVRIDRNANGTALQFRQGQSAIGTVTTTTSGVTYNTTSDIRLKQDIEPLEATDKLMQMNPVSYNWKADPDGPRSMGFIAQEMQEVMPEAVSTGDDDDAMMSMDYGRITPILVSALQDAHRKIEDLESRIAAMETNNE